MNTRRKIMIAIASDHDDDRINHRGFDFVFDLGRFLLELGQPRQDHFKHTADLAGLHHVDVEIVEDARMLREAVGKGAAALHRIGQFGDRAFQNRIALLFAENSEAAQQRQAGIDQRRELPRENHQHFRLNFLALEKNDVLCAGARRSRRGGARTGLAARRARFAIHAAALPSS